MLEETKIVLEVPMRRAQDAIITVKPDPLANYLARLWLLQELHEQFPNAEASDLAMLLNALDAMPVEMGAAIKLTPAQKNALEKP